ncbi:MAG: tRNA (guanosine(46)-N7)-methyltransferase TrmB [Pirellulaceae bacterium]
MGRRALKKLDPDVDLSRHYRTEEQLDRPFDPRTLFSCDAPLEVEIGSGKGLFLCAESARSPQHNFLGIEVSHKFARFAAARSAKHQRPNVMIIDGDAQPLMAETPDACLAAVHVYFPDPWWKKRHRKRRVMNEPMLRHIERTLVPGGLLHFWTDVEEYYRTTLALIAATIQLEGPSKVEETPAQHDLDYRTHFERRMRRSDLPVYRARYQK